MCLVTLFIAKSFAAIHARRFKVGPQRADAGISSNIGVNVFALLHLPPSTHATPALGALVLWKVHRRVAVAAVDTIIAEAEGIVFL